MTPTERWGAEQRSLLQVCNASTSVQIPEIWNTISPVKKYRSQSVMEAAYRRTADSLRFFPPRIPHAIAFMVMALPFHTKDPYRVGYALHIFLLTDLSSLAGLEAALLTGSGTRSW